METSPTDSTTTVLRISDAALEQIQDLRSQEVEADTLALWVEISGASGDSFTYDMYFQAVADASPVDWVDKRDGFAVVVPVDSVDRMRGAVLDLSRDINQGGMVIQNPNQPPPPLRSSPAMGPAPDLSGPVAQQVMQVLEHQINPAIASHGGRADLVAVEDETAYLRLSGGCAGCGMAAVTLSQGIEVAIFEAIPEITRVVDVTDHAAGTNPFYEAAKK
jgi:Fe/S biogenesis protein NfuA